MPNRAQVRNSSPTDADRERHIKGLAEVDTTQPIDQRPTELAPVVPAADTVALESVQASVRMAETLRRQRLLVFESETWHSLSGDLAAAEGALSEDQLVPPEVIGRILRRVEGWALQRHLNGDGDGGS